MVITEREGSSRTIAAAGSGVVDFKWSDGWSVFDVGRSPQPIPGFGVCRTACAVESFRLLQRAGIPTPYMKRIDERTVRVREFQVPGHEPLSGKAEGLVLPLEWLFRYEIGEKFRNRVRKGEISLDALGLPPGTDINTVIKLPRIFVECSTKFERRDRYLSDEEARKKADLDEGAWMVARACVVRAAFILQQELNRCGYDLLDGKFELGRTWDGRIMLVDVAGSPDEIRARKRVDGRLYCKEPLREYLETLPWREELRIAQGAYPDDSSHWPSYPVLPDDIVDYLSDLYREFTLDYTGKRVEA